MYKNNTQKLTEVKMGETGTGLLIEHDGHVIGNRDIVKQIKEDIEHHHEFVIPDKFVVNAVFQKYGIKNANGRVYPEDVLKREVGKYINERINININGHPYWSSVGALDHPENSALSGHDVTHKIINLQWRGHTLIGEMELHLSPGYRRYGICSTSGDFAANMILDDILIGVSSRGVGSVEERLGILEVGNDFDLIGWDVVLEPSTPNAYIGKSIEDISSFVESNETHDNKPIVNERLKRVNEILL